MSKFRKKIKKYLTEEKLISKDKYVSMSEGLSQEEIDENFEYLPADPSRGIYGECFYSIEKPDEEEYNEVLLFKLCRKQDETNELLTSIKKMLTFFTVITIISMIFGFIIGFYSVCSQL